MLRTGPKLQPQSARDSGGNVIPNGEHILHLPVVTLRPQVISILRVDQLRGHPDSISGPAHAAFKNRPYVERVAILRISCSLPRKAKAEVRAATFRLGSCASA